MKRPLEYALWCDCESDEERAVFLHSGRAVETGIVAPILATELAEAFLDRARLRAEVERLRSGLKKIQLTCHKHDYRTIWETCEEALK